MDNNRNTIAHNFIYLNELNKLEKYLKDNNYIYTRIDKDLANQIQIVLNTHQIIVYADADKKIIKWDAICHYGSYGYEEGLLEIYGDIVPENAHDSVMGWLTANDVIKLLEKENKNEH